MQQDLSNAVSAASIEVLRVTDTFNIKLQREWNNSEKMRDVKATGYMKKEVKS